MCVVWQLTTMVFQKWKKQKTVKNCKKIKRKCDVSLRLYNFFFFYGFAGFTHLSNVIITNMKPCNNGKSFRKRRMRSKLNVSCCVHIWKTLFFSYKDVINFEFFLYLIWIIYFKSIYFLPVNKLFVLYTSPVSKLLFFKVKRFIRFGLIQYKRKWNSMYIL